MPNDSGYLLDHETLQRIGRVIRDQERGVSKVGPADLWQTDQPEGTVFLEITGSVTATAGYYPAVEKWYDIENNTWNYAQDPCLAWEMNGAALESGKTYKGTLVRSVTDGATTKSVFSVQASGSGGGSSSGNMVYVQIQTNTGTSGLYNGYLINWDSSGNQSGAGTPIFVKLPFGVVLQSYNQYLAGYKASDAYTAATSVGGSNVTKPLYVALGNDTFPPISGIVVPSSETSLNGTYYGTLQYISGASTSGITWATLSFINVLIHNLNSTGASGSLTLSKRYQGILAGSSFAGGSTFGSQAGGYAIYAVTPD